MAGYPVKSPEQCDGPPKYSLLSTITPITLPDLHWTATSTGIEWESFLCNEGLEAYIDNCPPVTGYTLPSEGNISFCHADPFIVVGSYDCSPVGRPISEAFEIARKRLLNWESRQVEETLWTGNVANGDGTINPSFAFGNSSCSLVPVDVNAAGALEPMEAIALLESSLGDIVSCGGVIHVPYILLAYLARFNLLTLEGGNYYTPSGYKLVAGQGYPGSGPDNAAAGAGTAWIFGTGAMVLVRSNVMMIPDQVNESIDRNVNSQVVRAERFYSVGYSCGVLGVRVNL